MTERKPSSAEQAQPPGRQTEAQRRLEREAAALRQNLLRRKQQARVRQARKPEQT